MTKNTEKEDPERLSSQNQNDPSRCPGTLDPPRQNMAEGIGDGHLAHTLRVFKKYNALKISFLYDQLAQRKKLVFDLIPLLLHHDAAPLLNCPEACQSSPAGIYRYDVSPEVEKSFSEAFPGKPFPKLNPRASYDPAMPIKALSLIGSLGSVAQNAYSDFDYWVCLDGRAFTRKSFAHFRKKLAAIEEWALKFSGAEVHFFPMTLERIRLNAFGPAGPESSGSAQGKLLKEEFYRTMTHIAGQIPLWWAMPPDADEEEYNRWVRLANFSVRLDGYELADMGNVTSISLGEFYGAAIWQINKTVGSPFKSVLKMAMLEDYITKRGQRGLLCHELKQRVLRADQNLGRLDPYVLMLDRASDYLKGENRLDDLELLRQSFYLKVGEKLTFSDQRQARLPRKKHVMVGLVREWDWSQKLLDHLNNYHYWSFENSQQFSRAINAYIFRTYKFIGRELRQAEDVERFISPRDLLVLQRKLYVFYSHRPNKVESIRNVIEAPPRMNALTLQIESDPSGGRSWAAYRGFLSREKAAEEDGQSNLLKRSVQLSETLCWLVVNRLYSPDTSINLNSGPGPLAAHCTVPDIQQLLHETARLFPPYKHSQLHGDDLLRKPRVVRMFLIVNLDEPDHSQHVVSTSVCFQNNWGEVFFEGHESPHHGLQLARRFLQERADDGHHRPGSSFRIFLSSRHSKHAIVPRLRKYLGLESDVLL